MSDEIKVTQEDREAFKQLRGMFGPRVSGEVDRGAYDADWQMQLLASHRIASTRQLAADLAEAKEMLERYQTWMCGKIGPSPFQAARALIERLG